MKKGVFIWIMALCIMFLACADVNSAALSGAPPAGMQSSGKSRWMSGDEAQKYTEFISMALPPLPELPVEPPEESSEYVAYLTFDDGPSSNTQTLLNKLDEYGVKATFFVVGDRVEKYPNSVKEIALRGHSIGLHSYSHKYSQIYSSVRSFTADLAKTEEAMPTGYNKIYRFPGGVQSAGKMKNKLIEALKTKGYSYHEWNMDLGDGLQRKSSLESLKNRFSRTYKTGKDKKKKLVILLHDAAGRKASIEFLDTLIPALKRDGYVFKVLP